MGTLIEIAPLMTTIAAIYTCRTFRWQPGVYISTFLCGMVFATTVISMAQN